VRLLRAPKYVDTSASPAAGSPRATKPSVDRQIDEVAQQAQLDQLGHEAEALEKRDEALTAQDEAQRLHDAAGTAKADRKAS
jgi:hypothetical protein